MLLNIGFITAQSLKVRGVVLDSSGEVIIGASVSVQGNPALGVMTDGDGKFTLTVPEQYKKLTISFIGTKPKVVDVKPELKIILEDDARQLNEVVVTGMQKMDKRLFTGASTKLDAATTKIDGLADVSRSLEGRVAGVSVQNVSGTFGTAPKIRVRGATSIYGSSKPLWVVDGVIVESITDVSADDLSSGDAVTLVSSAIAGLNADDIESFNILKDGSATSIYGARAMAGVIVITTKKGKPGVSSISYTGEFTSRLVPSYNNFNIMNSQQQMSVYDEMKRKGWLNFADVYRARESGVYGEMYHLLNTYDEATGQFALQNTPEAINQYLRSAEMRNTDWFDLLFSSNITQNHSLSISSGTEKSSFYASLSAMTDPGWTKQSKVSRYTANLNTTYNFTKGLSINLISNASYRDQKAPGTLSQSRDVVSGEVKRDFDINPYSFALNTSRTLDTGTFYTRNYSDFNILHELDNNYMNLNVLDVKFQGEVRWKPIKQLELSALGALNYKATSQEHMITGNSNQAMAYRAGIIPVEDATIRENNPFLYRDPDNLLALPISILPEGGIYQRTDYGMRSVDMRATLSWSDTFNEKHLVNLFAGVENNSTDRRRTWFNGWGMQYDMGEIPFYLYQFFKKGIEDGNSYYSISKTYSRSVAAFTSLTYGYDGRYIFNLTTRDEASNKNNAKWLPTWNFGFSWNAHREKFFEKLNPVLSHFTTRLSYSLTASPVPDFVTNSNIVIKSFSSYRPFTNVQETGLQIENLQNSELTYEKKNEFNVGLDMGLISNRINVAFDWYTRKNFDLIGQVNTQGVGGETLKYANVADMESSGVELSISTKNIIARDFSWTTDFIFGKNKTKVTKLNLDSNVMDLISGSGFALQGYPNRGLFSIPFAGLDENGYPTFYREDGSVTTAQDSYIDFQNRSKISFLKYEGPTDPTITGSLGNVFKYKQLKLNLYVSYSFGNVIRLDPVFRSSYSDLTSMTREFKNRWMEPGDELKTDIPAIISKREYLSNTDLTKAYNAYNYSDVRIADGGFVRLKEVSVSYDFPKKLLGANVNQLSAKLQATNLFLLYADKKLNGQDPEFFRSGGVSNPVPQQFTLTIRANF